MAATAPPMTAARASSLRTLVIALTAFFTVVDLFATQAILPLLAHSYRVTPAAMSVAVNASTLGMAIAGLGVALFSRHLPRRAGIVVALVLLAVPTTLLAYAPGLHVFALLRIAQGLCMSTAFTLTLGYLGENCSAEDQAGAFAAYITGNVGGHDAGRRGHLLRAGHRDRLRQPRRERPCSRERRLSRRLFHRRARGHRAAWHGVSALGLARVCRRRCRGARRGRTA